MDIFRLFDSLNYLPNLKVAMEAVNETHAVCEAALCYSGDILDSRRDKFTLKYYVKMARELERQPEIIVAAEPTRGLDIESTRFIHDEFRAAANRGAAILLITSDLDEAFALGDAIHVIYRGTLSARLTPGEAADQAPMLMAGVGSRESGVGA